jgi:hypothetical protein
MSRPFESWNRDIFHRGLMSNGLRIKTHELIQFRRNLLGYMKTKILRLLNLFLRRVAFLQGGLRHRLSSKFTSFKHAIIYRLEINNINFVFLWAGMQYFEVTFLCRPKEILMMKCVGESWRGEVLVLCLSFVYSIAMNRPDLIL